MTNNSFEANARDNKTRAYDDCWLRLDGIKDSSFQKNYRRCLESVYCKADTRLAKTALNELLSGLTRLTGSSPKVVDDPESSCIILSILAFDKEIDSALATNEIAKLQPEGFLIKAVKDNKGSKIYITAKTDKGLLYGVFRFLLYLDQQKEIGKLHLLENPKNPIRMINQWDNLDGSIERGYAGRSIFYQNNILTTDMARVKYYARMLASVGINAIAINNVNAHKEETRLIADKIHMVKEINDIFRDYGIRVFLSINYASPIDIGGLSSADPLDDEVAKWWVDRVAYIYKNIPDFGGFLVKADSENRPGPFTYNRNHAEGANMLAAALKPYGGLLIWRCFVYNCQQDWRDLTIDRAKAAYENYHYLDGSFADNVILQIKNGPMDFQVREPVSPLIGTMERTNQMLELQITQEYTGQQRHLCYLVPQWKEILDFDTRAKGQGYPVKKLVNGSTFPMKHCGITAVSNIGTDYNWTGHYLAQANLYGYGRLTWDPDLATETITEEWIISTFGPKQELIDTISKMLISSWPIYENYTSPLGIGWMVNPDHHYGPSVDGYEYSKWGTYHRADFKAIGVDRTVAKGTGFTRQYRKDNYLMFENIETCPEELILFFHRLPYTYRLKSGKTIIQHIYDTHFEGVDQAIRLKEQWEKLNGMIDEKRFSHVLDRLKQQIDHAKEWRDVINSYFYRKTGICDIHSRKIY
ncbi:MAG: alpha-glucuronidase [Clostridiales bacterium]|jgi:alpha-glucuronidase|nr:alpha-glucuronidase family glycosyl hydrolase [Clostridia bacterium]NLH57808.1 alpha-glucuronidase [Clostridiales bacterium]